MGYIYKITNTINEKVYIGQTIYSIEKRFKKHIQIARKKPNRPLYDAMNKYGIDNFKLSLIEQVDNNFLDEREKYWIKYYNSIDRKYGYNYTSGGHDGFTYSTLSYIEKSISFKKRRNGFKEKSLDELPDLDPEVLLNKLKESTEVVQVANYFGVKNETIYQWTKKFFNTTPSTLLTKIGKIYSNDKINRNNIALNIDKESLYLDIKNDKLSKKDISIKYNVSVYLLDKLIFKLFGKTFKELKGSSYRHQPEDSRNKIRNSRKGKKLKDICKDSSLEFVKRASLKRMGSNNCNYKNVDKDKLYYYLIDETLTMKEIAEKFGVSKVTILSRCRQYFNTIDRKEIRNNDY